jgi:hypothetical protein
MSKKTSRCIHQVITTDVRSRKFGWNISRALSLAGFLIVSTISFKTTLGQDSTYKTFNPVFVGASFLYDFPKSYGITAAVNYPFASIVKDRISRDGRATTSQKNRFWGMEAGVYRYPYNYTGILLVPFIGVRHYV